MSTHVRSSISIVCISCADQEYAVMRVLTTLFLLTNVQWSQRNTLHPCAHGRHMGCTTDELVLKPIVGCDFPWGRAVRIPCPTPFPLSPPIYMYRFRWTAYDLGWHALSKLIVEPRHVISNNVAFCQVLTHTSLSSLLLSLETPNAVQ